MKLRREEKRVGDGDQGREESADDVEAHDGAHRSAGIGVLLRHGVHDEYEDEHGRDALERLYEEVAEYGDRRHDLRQGNGDDDAEDKSDGDELDQGSFLILSADGFEQRNSSFGDEWIAEEARINSAAHLHTSALSARHRQILDRTGASVQIRATSFYQRFLEYDASVSIV